jgi:hypothetical protein
MINLLQARGKRLELQHGCCDLIFTFRGSADLDCTANLIGANIYPGIPRNSPNLSQFVE